MKKIFVILGILIFAGCSFAGPMNKYYDGIEKGTFKKKSNGTIVQYDKKGKKIGTYKNINGKFVKIK